VLRSALWAASLVGAGGFLGSLLRWVVSGWVQRQLPLAAFPYGTLAVNLTGCFLIGAAACLIQSRGLLGPDARVFALIGVLGGFTTFSTFGYETFALARDGESLAAAANVGAHVFAGLGAVWLGWALTGAVAR
jgi:CrcB protein